MSRTLPSDVALLLLRLSGLGLALAHGYGKVVALSTGQGDRFIAGVEALGFPLPGLFAWAAALAEVHAALGEKDEALKWLAEAEKEHSPELLWLGMRPAFRRLRTEPAVMSLIEKVGVATSGDPA